MAAEALPAIAARTTSARPFVVFSDDWGDHPSSSQHIFRTIGAEVPVLWVNTVGMRTPRPTLSDLRKAVRKISRMLFARRANPPARAEGRATPRHLRVIQPLMLPFSGIGVVRRFNRFMVLRAVRTAMGEHGIAHPVVVSTVPNACDFVDGLAAARIAYYCVDDFSKWPGLEHELVLAMERSLVAKSNVLIATSEKLFRLLQASGKPTHLLTHGVDLVLFSSVPPAEHASLASIPRPRAGYFGLFDERSDQDLLAALAGSMPDFSFVIAGPVVTGVDRLRRLANVHFVGPVAYGALPALVKGLDALIIPYVVNELTDSISPLKLKEYLATGKPVITTPLAEAKLRGADVTVAASVAEWQAALRTAPSADVPQRRQTMLARLAHDSWPEKASSLVRLCTA